MVELGRHNRRGTYRAQAAINETVLPTQKPWQGREDARNVEQSQSSNTRNFVILLFSRRSFSSSPLRSENEEGDRECLTHTRGR